MKTIPQPSEKQIQTAIIHYLQYKQFYVQRLNSGRIPIEKDGKKRLIMLADKGTPDLMAFRKTKDGKLLLLFIEVKKPGKYATPAQIYVMQELEEHGAFTLVATSVDMVEQFIGMFDF